MTVLAFFLAVAWKEHADEVQATAAVLIALGVIGRFVVLPVVRFFQRMERALGAVEEQLLTNNGGSTLKDKVEKIMRHLGLEVKDRKD